MAAKVISALQVVRDSESLAGNTFKVRAYNNVLTQLARLPPDSKDAITSVDDLKAAGITGIGKSIEKKITEILDTGKLAAADGIKSRVEAFNALSKIHGIGHAKASELIDANIDTIDKLKAAVESHPDMLTPVQTIGLAHYADFQKRIPRKEMLRHEAVLKEAFGKYFGTVTIAGSFRRGAASSGDIDVLITKSSTSWDLTEGGRPRVKSNSNKTKQLNSNEVPVSHGDNVASEGGARKTKVSKVQDAPEEITEFHMVVGDLQRSKYITDILALGEKKCMAVVKLPRCRTYRRLDILLTPPSEYPFALLYFTGSQEFNIGMRSHALSRGYTLNEHGMKSLNPKVSISDEIKDERDIFAYLKLGFVRPEDRTENIFVD